MRFYPDHRCSQIQPPGERSGGFFSGEGSAVRSEGERLNAMVTIRKKVKKILYIEDNKDTCELFSVVLSRAGYEMVAAHTLADGLAAARNESFSLYMLDNWLPDGSGVKACRLLKEFDPVTPIVMCSAAVYEKDHLEASGAGAQAYLDKPVELDKLVEVVNGLIKGASQAGPVSDR